MPLTIEQTLQQAIALHQAEKLEEAGALYQTILQNRPSHPEANHNMGVLAVQMGQPAAALSYLMAALEADPARAAFWLSYIDALFQAGQLDAAKEVLALARQQGLEGDEADALVRRLEGDAQNEPQNQHPAPGEPDRNPAAHPEANPNALITLFGQGRFAEAANLAQEMTAQFPLYGFGWKALGVAFKQMGRSADALEPMRKAAALLPDDADAYGNLGAALQDLGRMNEAEASLRRALNINPDNAQVLSNLGFTLQALGRLDEAEASLRRALHIKPDLAEAHNNLGNTLKALGRLEEAETSYRQTLQLKPDYAEVHYNLGLVLQNLGRLGEAETSYRRALEINPGYVMAHNNLGLTLMAMGRPEEAEATLRRALQIAPDYADACCNLGAALMAMCRPDEAEASYRRALEISPDNALAHSNLGVALHDLGRLDEAEASYRLALEIKPDYADAYSNLLFLLNFRPEKSREEILAVCRGYEERFGLPRREKWRAHGNSREPGRRLRVGYLSPDFCRHAVAYFAEPIFANHDKSQVEVFCYAEVRREDEFTRRFRQLADHWHSTVGLGDDAVAQMIRDHRIDILVDLAGHTRGNRLLVFALKPAPVQLTYLGYPGSTGLAAMDYRITDHYADPEGIADACYTERLLRLPGSLWCYRPTADMPEPSPLPALSRGYLTFGSFNNFNKIDRPTLTLWAELLRALPAARLMMLTVPEGECRLRLAHTFAELGIEAQRLEFHGKLPAAEFHRKFLEVDFTLDPVTVNGATTTCESLWMGVPVISLAGERFLTRAGLSILSVAGLTDFAAASREDCLRLAARLAANLPLLAEIRAGLRTKVAASPLIDEAGFTRNLENLYRDIWKKWCRSG